MVVYVPGTEETDPKKQNMSLQQLGGGLTAATTNIATNTSDIATANANIAANTTNIATNTTNIATNTATLAALTGSKITASLGADVLLNNISNYFDGPSIAQGSTGTWFVSGAVVVSDTASACSFFAKLWDGTTVIASGFTTTSAANFGSLISLSGYLSSPAGNLRISVRDPNTTTGKMAFNTSGNSKDCTISAHRIA